MPNNEYFGAQPSIELLRQKIERGGFYDRGSKKIFKTIINTNILSIGAHPSGARNNISSRFSRHFTIININSPNKFTLRKMFNTLLTEFFNSDQFSDNVKKISDSIVSHAVEL